MVGLDIHMPKSCHHCVCRSTDFLCPITGVMFNMGTFTMERLPSCPLVDLDKKETKTDTELEELMEHGFEILYNRLIRIGVSEEAAVMAIERLLDALNDEEVKRKMAEAMTNIWIEHVDFDDLPDISAISNTEVLHE